MHLVNIWLAKLLAGVLGELFLKGGLNAQRNAVTAWPRTTLPSAEAAMYLRIVVHAGLPPNDYERHAYHENKDRTRGI